MHDTWSPNHKQVDQHVDRDLRLSPQKWQPKSSWLHFAKQAIMPGCHNFKDDILYWGASFLLAPTSAQANPSPWTPCLWKPEKAPWWLLVRRSNLAHPRSSNFKRTWNYVFHIKEKKRNSMQGPGNIRSCLVGKKILSKTQEPSLGSWR